MVKITDANAVVICDMQCQSAIGTSNPRRTAHHTNPLLSHVVSHVVSNVASASTGNTSEHGGNSISLENFLCVVIALLHA